LIFPAIVPKHMDEFLDQKVETVITVCSNADQACPMFPGSVNRHHWGLTTRRRPPARTRKSSRCFAACGTKREEYSRRTPRTPRPGESRCMKGKIMNCEPGRYGKMFLDWSRLK